MAVYTTDLSGRLQSSIILILILPTTQALPMQFVDSAAIAQHSHRCVVNQALRGKQRLATGHQEIRRGPFGSSAAHLFRVSLDNCDELRKVYRKTAELIVGDINTWGYDDVPRKESLGLLRLSARWQPRTARTPPTLPCRTAVLRARRRRLGAPGALRSHIPRVSFAKRVGQKR